MPCRRLRAAVGLLGLVLFLPPSATAAPLCPLNAVPGGHTSSASNCCAQFSCAQGSPGLAGGRQSVVLAVIDDHGYCQYGFMGGRCAGPRVGGTSPRRCTGAVCSNAAWLGCAADGDCPPGGTCAAGPSVCDPGETCTNGYCSQCTTDADCDAGQHEMCLEGLCSPRAACDSSFQCARSVGTCTSGVCSPSGAPCGSDADCHDVCTLGFCERTPAPCTTNVDCGPPGAGSPYVCTTSRTPLRLNDLSCRGRQPGDDKWEFSRAAVAPPGELTVYTPTIDAIAREGAVFPRTRVNGQNCKPTRAAMLLGRYLRHRSPGSSGQCRETGTACTTAEFGQTNTPHCPGVTNVCDPLHSFAWWLEHSPSAVDTYTIAAGKTEVRAASLLSFDTSVQNSSSPQFARFPCDAQCEAALNGGAIPAAATKPVEPKGFDQLVAAVRSPAGAIDANGVLQRPVVLWYAPKVPHAGYTAPQYFRRLYGPGGADPQKLDRGEEHLARTSHFDAGFAAFVDELKRTCICDSAAGAMTSLWDHTVAALIADNAFLMPGSKNDGSSAQANENAHRTALIVDTPAHRSGAQAPHVLDEQSQYAGSPDVFPTLLQYAGIANPDTVDDYPLNKALQPYVENGMAAGLVRPIYYGHAAASTQARQTANGLRAYAVPTPAVLGLCANPGSQTPLLGHQRPCLADGDCGCASGDGCCAIGARRCTQDPRLACTDDADCASAGLCQAGQCAGSSYHDFDGRACTADVDCLPPGVCRPPMLKAYQTGKVARSVTQLFDVNFDPDQTTNLLQVEPGYLGNGTTCPANGQPQSLGETLDCCLAEFWTLAADKTWARASLGCPAALRPSLLP